MRTISVAIPTYNRFEMVVEAVSWVMDDPRITEIVICDDASTDDSFEKLGVWAAANPKVKLFRNEKNLDCYANKAQALRHATNDWVVLFDSDNIMGKLYLEALEKVSRWYDDCSYLPVFAEPYFDYREFEGQVINKSCVARYMTNSTFCCALNTANYLVHRQTYLSVWDPDVNPHTSDSIYMNYRLLEAGKCLLFVPGLSYVHRIHPQSHYVLNCYKTGGFAGEVERKLRALK